MFLPAAATTASAPGPAIAPRRGRPAAAAAAAAVAVDAGEAFGDVFAGCLLAVVAVGAVFPALDAVVLTGSGATAAEGERDTVRRDAAVEVVVGGAEIDGGEGDRGAPRREARVPG